MTFLERVTMWPNPIAGVAAGRMPEFVEMIQVGPSHSSGSVRLYGRYATVHES